MQFFSFLIIQSETNLLNLLFMLLHEIISISERGTSAVRIDFIVPYKKSLKTYFERYYNSEPVLIVTAVFNACSYGFICPANEMHDAIDIYLNEDKELSEEDKEQEREVISSQSIMLYSL
jgi:hypothetical protein